MNLLQKQFPEIYRDFFSSCTKVASAPHSFFWFGELAGIWGGLTIVQKLPIRFYVGLQSIEPTKFEVIGEFYAYNHAKDEFELVHFDDFVVKRLEKLELKGWRLRFLSEISIGVSLGAIGALSAGIALLTGGQDKIFDRAWEVAKTIQDGVSSGATAYAACIDAAYPIVFTSHEKKFRAKPLDQLFGLKGQPAWPIDFGLIFSGKIVKGETVVNSIRSARQTLEENEHKLGDMTPIKSWESYLGMLNLVSQEGVIALGELLKKGAQEGALERLFDLMNQYQNLMHFLAISTPEIDEIYSAIHQLANKQRNRVGSGAKITGLGKGGDVLLALPFGQYRDALTTWLLTTGYSLDYASWRDGFEIEGVRIEQDIESKQYSPFLKGNLVVLKYWRDRSYQELLREYTEIKPKDFDLLLDSVNQKVYIKGKPVNSKKLPSQKAVVTIIGKLLESPDWQLQNSEIPLETYAHSRYDLHGKVVIPFLKAISGGKQADFSLKVSGGLYDDYTLTMAANQLKTGLVKRLS